MLPQRSPVCEADRVLTPAGVARGARCGSFQPLFDPLCFCVVHRQLYAQDAACRPRAGERDSKSLQRLSKEEYLKMMLLNDPAEDGTQKVRKGPQLGVIHRNTKNMLVNLSVPFISRG